MLSLIKIFWMRYLFPEQDAKTKMLQVQNATLLATLFLFLVQLVSETGMIPILFMISTECRRQFKSAILKSSFERDVEKPLTQMLSIWSIINKCTRPELQIFPIDLWFAFHPLPLAIQTPASASLSEWCFVSCDTIFIDGWLRQWCLLT